VLDRLPIPCSITAEIAAKKVDLVMLDGSKRTLVLTDRIPGAGGSPASGIRVNELARWCHDARG
jgi:hypothetical protein